MMTEVPERIIADAREGLRVNNSFLGGLLSPKYKVPRDCGAGVRDDALAIIGA